MLPVNQNSLRLSDYGAVGDGVTDDTQVIQQFFNNCSSTGSNGILDNRTFIVTHLTYPSNLHIDGNGATFLQKPGTGASMALGSNYAVPIASGGGNSNITFENMTWDGNASNQPNVSASITQMFQAIGVQNFKLRNVTLRGAFANTLYISRIGTEGAGPNGIPAFPNGQQVNYNVSIEGCTIDGSSMRAPNVDTCDIEGVQKLVVRDSIWKGASQNLLGVSFCTDFNIENNEFSAFQFGINAETSSWGTIQNNGFYLLGGVTQGTPDQLSTAIWLDTYNASMGTTGYSGCDYVKISGNKIRNLAKTGAAGLVGIFVQGQAVPAGGNNGIIIEGNHLSYFIAPNECYYIVVDGGNTNTVVANNVIIGSNTNLDEVGIYVGGWMSLAGSLSDTTVANNIIKSCQYGIVQNGKGHTGTMLIGNNTRACWQGYSIANPKLDGYVNIGSI